MTLALESLVEEIIYETVYEVQGEIGGREHAVEKIVEDFPTLAAAAALDLNWEDIGDGVIRAEAVGLTFFVIDGGWNVFAGDGRRLSTGVKETIDANKEECDLYYRNRITQIFGGTP